MEQKRRKFKKKIKQMVKKEGFSIVELNVLESVVLLGIRDNRNKKYQFLILERKKFDVKTTFDSFWDQVKLEKKE